jgi:hypothetical protein
MEEGAESFGNLLEVSLVHRRVQLHDRQVLIAETVAAGDVDFVSKQRT